MTRIILIIEIGTRFGSSPIHHDRLFEDHFDQRQCCRGPEWSERDHDEVS